ncbi:MAG TPA: carboxypeptidase-like regulatory domain-containing protein [Candidatus Saccharimonadales bacterium]|nr:carboxypeptidase-like regulatory domain-containing protein [Candidatus Saccharimonadales bacterium]
MRFLPRFVLSVTTLFFWQSLQAQQTSVPPQESPAVPGNRNPGTQSDNKNGKPKPIPSFLIIGTVFNEHALSFPGVQIRIRRAGEKKYEWETYTNARGEFAVRVPPGHDYEVLAHIKQYKDQTKSVDSKVDVQQRLSIQLEPVRSSKTGAKS